MEWINNTDSTSEVRRSKNRNANAIHLQYMYNGDSMVPLKCLMTDTVGIVQRPVPLKESVISMMDIEFNHIVQINGVSIHKSNTEPSDLFRGADMSNRPERLLEFMKIIPLAPNVHKYITTLSKQKDMNIDINILKEISKHYTGSYTHGIPWVLKNKNNFNIFCEDYNLNLLNLDYEGFIKSLTINNKQ